MRVLFLILPMVFLSHICLGYRLPDANPKPFQSREIKFLQQISKGVADLAQEASGAIVFVSVSKRDTGTKFGEIDPFDFFFGPNGSQSPQPEYRQKGLGSGFFIDLDKGYLVTNNHVIQGAQEISLKLANGAVYPGHVVGSDPNTDVAIVKVEAVNFERKGLTQLIIGNSDNLRTGEWVIAVGAPFGLESSVSFGILSARHRGNLNITTLGNFLQTDAAINPGNSGGPLLDTNGQVIGMNTAIYSRSGSSAGIGFAVPSNIVKRSALQLISQGHVARGYLGVRLQPLNEALVSAFGLPSESDGVVVVEVQPQTPASIAKLEEGDVIVAIDDTKVATPSEVTNAIGLRAPGARVRIGIFRDGKKRTLTAMLSDFPKNHLMVDRQSEPSEALAGMSLTSLDPSRSEYNIIRSQFEFESKQGLVVTSLAPGSLAAAAGIQVGDVLRKANRKNLKDIHDFTLVYQKAAKILIHLERRGNFLFASLKK